MKSKAINKTKITIENRKAWGRLDEKIKERIVKEIKEGMLGQREASRRYGIPRTTINIWQHKSNLVTLLNADSTEQATRMTESQESKMLLKQIQELTKALDQAQLKIIGLETMIEVAESDLHIKIRKKRGAKQS
jgi:transposase-like protein